MKSVFLLFIILLSGQILMGQRQSVFIAPQNTDPTITTNLNNHYVSINRSVTPKNQLFVFFAGTGAVAFNYLEINNTAADLGFHSINLNYPNDQPVNTLCGNNIDLNCYGNVRLETIDGVNRTMLINVNRPNSIENRLIKLIIFLRNQFPNDNWGQFLIDDSTINWSKIVVSGHSQGGGHAGIIARYNSVLRAVMFSAMDFNGLANAPANWISQPNSTPNASTPDKFWGFSHFRDNFINFQTLSTQIWPAYGMLQFGAVVNVDNTSPPYNFTHSLTTDLECEETHGCVVGDARLTRLPDGTPIYKPVWEYLLSNTIGTPNISSIQIFRGDLQITRRPVGISNKYFRITLQGSGFNTVSKVIINGIEVETEFINPNWLRAKLPAGKTRPVGSSTLRVNNQNGILSNEIVF